MVDTSLAAAIKEHIANCASALDKASSSETIHARANELQQAQTMHSNPELFFEVQRAMYFWKLPSNTKNHWFFQWFFCVS